MKLLLFFCFVFVLFDISKTVHIIIVHGIVSEYGSSSDSDTETPSVDQAWRRDNDSDAESIDSDQEDPLK